MNSGLYDTTEQEIRDAPVISATYTTKVLILVGCGIVEALMNSIFLKFYVGIEWMGFRR